MLQRLITAIAVAGAVAMFAEPAAAQTCAKGPASATGRASLTQAGARVSARIAWRRSISATRSLGPRYALVSRSKARSYSCRPAGRRTICRFTAIPCRV